MKIKWLRYNRKKVYIALFLFLVLFGLTFGYAFVTTKLSIEGVARVKDAKWDIHFTNYQPIQGSVTPEEDPVIANTSITFSAKLENPGDFYGFTIDVTNQGTINANISNVSVTPDFSTMNYLDSTIAYSNGVQIKNGDILPAGKTRTIKVYLKYKEGIDENLYPTTDQLHNVTVALGYEQYVGEVPTWVLPEGKTANALALGDELCFGDQCFNFIRYDGNDAIMLAKYNLKVGRIYNMDTYIDEYTSDTTGYGLQSSDMLGWTESGGDAKGVVPFAAKDEFSRYYYVSDEYNIPNQEYGTEYPADVYDTDYVDKPVYVSGELTADSTRYSVAYYVELYKSLLVRQGVAIKDARLLMRSELMDSTYGCDYDQYEACSKTGITSFYANTSYWLGTAVSDNWLGIVCWDGRTNINYQGSNTFGVRPVIIVEKSEL